MPSSMRSLLVGLAVVGSLGIETAALAADRPITFAEAVALADRNPRVLAGREASRSLARSHDASPAMDANPVVAVAAGPRVAPSSERGLEGSVSLSQSISLQGAAARRKDALGAESEWLSADVDADLTARRLAAASTWLALWEAERQLAVVATDLANEEELVRLVARLASVRERTEADLATAEARLADAKLRERMAEGSLVEAQARFGAEMRAADGDALRTEGSPPEFAMVDGEREQLLLATSALPAVRAKELLARSELFRANEERAARGTRLTVGAELRRDALDANVVQGTLSLPLPIFAVGAREYASRSAASVRLAGEAVDEQGRARAALAFAFHEVEHTEEVFQLLVTRLVPAAERAASLRERQLKVGEGTLLDVIDARRGVLEARTRLVRATRERSWARIYIRLLSEMTRGAR